MGKRKKVVIVGIPKFSKKLAAQLNHFQSDIEFRSFDTYYNVWDKFKVLYHIRNAELVYSINGTLTKSRVLDYTIQLNKKIILHWVGTDVLKSIKAYESGIYERKYIEYCLHLCEIEWIQNELKQIEINAELQNIAIYNKNVPIAPIPKTFSVLTYLHPDREKFYGIDKILHCAKEFRNVQFNIVGSSGIEESTPSNVKFYGWVSNLDEMIRDTALCLRLPEHDGLSFFVLESLAQGKAVGYTYKYPHCHECKSAEDLSTFIKNQMEKFNNGESIQNLDGVEFVKNEFNREKVFSSLLEKMDLG